MYVSLKVNVSNATNNRWYQSVCVCVHKCVCMCTYILHKCYISNNLIMISHIYITLITTIVIT